MNSIATGLSNGSSPIFYYYNSNYDGSTNALAQPINVAQVRFIEINLVVPNQITKQENSSFSVTSGAAIRSIKDNLGN